MKNSIRALKGMALVEHCLCMQRIYSDLGRPCCMSPILRDDVSKIYFWREKCFLCKPIKSYAMTLSAAAEFTRSERRVRHKNSFTSVDID